MAFGARNDEGWRLCLRKGKTIFYVNETLFPEIPIEFRSQAKCKACADELNEDWKEYEKSQRPGLEPTPDLFSKFLTIVLKHDGIEQRDYEEIMNAA